MVIFVFPCSRKLNSDIINVIVIVIETPLIWLIENIQSVWKVSSCKINLLNLLENLNTKQGFKHGYNFLRVEI